MNNWNVELAADRQTRAKVTIQSGIFQGDSRSLLYVIAMTTFNHFGPVSWGCRIH